VTRLRHLRRQARLAWHVLRGRPLAYRVRVHGGLELIYGRTHVIDCEILTGRAPSAAIEVVGGNCLVLGCAICPAPGAVPASFTPVTGNWLDPESRFRYGRFGTRAPTEPDGLFDGLADDVGTSTPIGPFTAGDPGEAP
jgi:hypothetical protein